MSSPASTEHRQIVHSSRYRVELYQKCKRLRWLECHQNGHGITPVRKPLPLVVGGSVHVGQETLLRAMIGDEIPKLDESWARLEESAVRAALADFSQYARQIAPPDAEQAALAPKDLPIEARERVLSEFDDFLYKEQSSLVEALVRAYARRRLRPLLEQFEVLEVEREGTWKLSEMGTLVKWCANCHKPWGEDTAECGLMVGGTLVAGCGGRTFLEDDTRRELWFISRPDALLLERISGQLYIQSFKTTASWDYRRELDAQHDMQGLSEGVEIERRLGNCWQLLHMDVPDQGPDIIKQLDMNPRVVEYLRSLPAPPRITGIRYEFLLKGERWEDKELSARLGVKARVQKSHLIRPYVCISVPERRRASTTPAFDVGDLCWSWEYHTEAGEAKKLAWQNWNSRPIWEHGMSVKDWIDKLDTAAESMSAYDSTEGFEPRSLGFACDVQKLGFTDRHPLDAVFVPPMIVYRNDDELRDWIDQVEEQEREVSGHVAQVESARDESERRHLLNQHFGMTRRACVWPTICGMDKICWGGEEIRRDPVGSGLYKIREYNRPQEGGDT